MKTTPKIISTGIIAAAIALAAIQAQAATLKVDASVKTSDKTMSKTMDKTAEKMAAVMAKGDKEIDARVSSLSNLSVRVSQMKRVTDAQKASINSEIQTLAGNLTNLKAKIDAESTDTSASSTAMVKADTQSITQAYRVYALVVPQISIVAAIDRIGTITNSMTVLGTKIQTRISQAQAAGKDVASLNTSFSDYTSKIADANTQTQTALNLILPLVPDNGDTTVAASNKTSLTTARADIKKAVADIAAARKDAGTIVKALAGMHLTTQTSSTATSSTVTGTMTASSSVQ